MLSRPLGTRLSHTDSGMEPLKLLPRKVAVLSLVSLLKLSGIRPWKLFSSNSTKTKSTSLPTSSLSVPSNRFSSISNTFKVFRLNRLSLMEPERRFWSRSSTCKLSPLHTPDPHSSGMVPEVRPPSRVRFRSLLRANTSAGKVPPRLFCSNPIMVMSVPVHLLPAQSHSELPDRYGVLSGKAELGPPHWLPACNLLDLLRPPFLLFFLFLLSFFFCFFLFLSRERELLSFRLFSSSFLASSQSQLVSMKQSARHSSSESELQRRLPPLSLQHLSRQYLRQLSWPPALPSLFLLPPFLLFFLFLLLLVRAFGSSSTTSIGSSATASSSPLAAADPAEHSSH
mmetsp:Transcript_26670/g.58417  ORF Transcript_26670/g.58417 Transcript_26670/m.58417 type:complete len:340 (+) Transcript_26670:291-1310(+)